MAEKTKFTKGKVPSYSGDGVGIWKNKSTTTNDTYLSVSVLGGKGVNCFAYKPKYPKENDPDFKGLGVKIWKQKKGDELYLTVQVLTMPAIDCRKFVPRPKPKPVEDEEL